MGSGVPGIGVRIPAFDGVRGIAVLAVITFHCGLIGTGGLDQLVGKFTGMGWLGVDLFFVLSGFLITGILLDSKGADGYFRKFYARRTLRIFPLFYAVAIGATIVVPLAYRLGIYETVKLDGYTNDLWASKFWLLTYTHNFLQATEPHTLPGLGHLWSLAIEEQFYLLWPLVVFLIPRNRLLVAIGTICLAVEGLRIGLVLNDTDPWAIRQWTFTRIDSLLLGGAAAAIVRSPTVVERLRPFLRPIVALTTVALVFFALDGPVHLDSNRASTTIFLLAAVCFGTWFIRICIDSVPTFLEAKWLRTVGFYSYAMYVFHWPIVQGVKRATQKVGITDALSGGGTTLPAMAFNLGIVIAASFVAAWLSWRFWESRWLALKQRFAYKREAFDAPALDPIVEPPAPRRPRRTRPLTAAPRPDRTAD